MSEEMKLPRAIRVQAEQARQIEEQLMAPAPAPAPVPDPAAEQTPAPAPAESSAPPSDELVTLRAENERLKQRDRTAEGMVRADMARLREQVEQQSKVIQSMNDQLQTAKQALEKKAQEGTTLDKQDIEAFGTELVEMVRRQAVGIVQQTAREQLGDVMQRVASLEEAIGGVRQEVAVTAEQQFIRDMDTSVSNWRVVNEDPKFIAWLAEIDPVYGVPRQHALHRAHAQLDGPRAATIFKTYLATLPAPKPAAKDELQTQVSPSRTGAADTPAPEQKVYRLADYEQLQTNLARAIRRGDHAEVARLQKEEVAYDNAVAEGRLVR